MNHNKSLDNSNEFTALKKVQTVEEEKMIALSTNSTMAKNKEKTLFELTNKPIGNSSKKAMSVVRGRRSNASKTSINTAKRIREAERNHYEKLQSLLPINSSTKPKRTTRVDILKQASDYIEILQRMIEDLTDDVLEELIDDPKR